jgi:membrane protease YdiL (CAAX protease family)
MEHRRGIYFMIFLLFWYVGFIMVLRSMYTLEVIARGTIESPWFIVFTQVMGLLVPLGVWLAIFRERINENLPHMRLGMKNVFLLVVLAILMQPPLMLISGLTSLLFPNEMGAYMQETAELHPYWLMIIAIAVTPAICEEVVFRGYIQSKFKNTTFWYMALVNGLFFAIIHLNAHQFTYAFMAGVIFAYVVFATRSIRAGIIMHFVLNAVQVTLVFALMALANWAENYLETASYGVYDDLLYGADMETIGLIVFFVMLGMIAAGCIVGIVFILRHFAMYNRRRVEAYEAKNPAPPGETVSIPVEISADERQRNRLADTALIGTVCVMFFAIMIFL